MSPGPGPPVVVRRCQDAAAVWRAGGGRASSRRGSPRGLGPDPGRPPRLTPYHSANDGLSCAHTFKHPSRRSTPWPAQTPSQSPSCAPQLRNFGVSAAAFVQSATPPPVWLSEACAGCCCACHGWLRLAFLAALFSDSDLLPKFTEQANATQASAPSVGVMHWSPKGSSAR